MLHELHSWARRGFLVASCLFGVAAFGSDACPSGCTPCALKEGVDAVLPGLSWGADVRLRSEYLDDAKLDDQAGSAEVWRQRFRARLWTTVQPADRLSFTARLSTEPRYFARPDIDDPWQRDEALIDQLFFDWKSTGPRPIRARVGRQDIVLGDEWLVRRGTPGDSSRTNFFDAVRMTLTLDDRGSDVDLIGLRNHANSAWLARPFNDAGLDLAEQDASGAILYARHRRFVETELDSYFIYKHNDKVAGNGNDAEIYTFGTRLAGALSHQWDYSAEFAPQFGYKNDTDIRALGLRGRLAYTLEDAWDSRLSLGYEYRSGHDDPDGAFDILWGRHGGNIANIVGPLGTLEGQVCHPSNFHLIRLGWTARPTEAVCLACDWGPMFRDNNPFAGTAGFSDDGRLRGQLVTGTAQYAVNRHARTYVLCETFFPGDYYESPQDQAGTYLRWEVMLTW